MLTNEQIHSIETFLVMATPPNSQRAGMIKELAAQAKLANELQAKLVKATNDALEEAAKVCEDSGDSIDGMWKSSSINCAIRIRALKEKP